MAEDFFQRALPIVEQLFLTRLVGAPASPREGVGEQTLRLLDVCCGSGQMARALTGRGFQVTGLDYSTEMLRLARQNAPAAEFICVDARCFSLPPVFAGALSTFNSFAHIDLDSELEAVFRNVCAALLPDAPFLFDLSMEEAYTSKWRGSFAAVAEDHACIVRPSYDPGRHLGRNEITLFRAYSAEAQGSHPRSENAAIWVRSDFCIEQKCRSELAIRSALQAAGFAAIETYDAQRDLGMAGEWGRVFFLCW